jgi:hypothetical protein
MDVGTLVLLPSLASMLAEFVLIRSGRIEGFLGALRVAVMKREFQKARGLLRGFH